MPSDTSGSKNAVQAIGSTVTYGKLYTFCALLNIATGEDDDAQTAVEFISAEQLANLEALISETESNAAKMATYFKVPALAYLPVNLYSRAVKALEDKRK
jgi:hypothetical protein